jgi:hypothetical protein
MPDIAESAFEFFDAPVYDDFWPSIDESRLEFGGQVEIVAPPPTLSPPLITNLVPTPGTGLYASNPIQFDVTDPDTMVALLVLVAFPTGAYEVVHDGVAFAAAYVQSTRTAIANGFHFVLLRSGGWPASPSVSVVAVDAFGAIAP